MQERFTRFIGIITELGKQISRIRNSEAEELGIVGSDLLTMFHIYNSDSGLFASDIAKATRMDKAAISRSISRLHQEGYIDYVDLPEGKKYRTYVNLTDRGRNIAEEINQRIVELVKEITADYSAADSKIMYEVLEHISEKLAEIENR